jgi:hypothetical protein
MLTHIQTRPKTVLAITLAVIGSAGCVLSKGILSTRSEAANSFLFGFSFQRLLLWSCLFGLSIICLITAGEIIRNERFFYKLTWIFQLPGRRIFQHLSALWVLINWILVFWWNGSLSQLFPHLDATYQRMSPLFVWGLVASFLFFLFSSIPWHIDFSSGVTRNGSSASEPIRQHSGLAEVSISLGIAAAALILYVLLLKIGFPRQLVQKFRYDFVPILLPLIWIATAAVAHPRRWGFSLGLTIVMLLFGTTLVALWTSGVSEDGIVAGLYPWTDPSSYYSDALRLANGLTSLVNWGGRPLFEVFLSLLLQLTHQNLQACLGILVAINAICALLLAREITRLTNQAGGALALILYFMYFRQFSGTTLTENLGLPVGALALLFLLRGARLNRLPEQLWGIILLSFALNIRPASMLMIPAVMIWFALNRNHKKNLAIGLLIAGLLSVSGFAVNAWLNKQISPEGAVMFSRFPNTLYGVAMGGEDWAQINIDHPELNALHDPELSQQIYKLAFTAILDNPLRFVKGALQMVDDLFWVNMGAFVFVRGGSRSLIYGLRQVLYLLAGLGLIWAFQRRKSPVGSLMLWLTAGLILSCPFVPPRDSDRMRTYASVMPLIFLLPALGTAWLTNGMEQFSTEKDAAHIESAAYIPGLVGSGLFVFVLVSALFWVRLQARTNPTASESITCPTGQTALSIAIRPGSYLKLVSADSQAETHFPNLRINDYEHSIGEFSYSSTFSTQPVETDTYLLNTIDMRTGNMIWVNLPVNSVPEPGNGTDSQLLNLCARTTGETNGLYWYANYFPK